MPTTGPTGAPSVSIDPDAATISTVSGIQEAKAAAPQSGMRPGGALRQPRDNAARRAVTVQKGDTVYDLSNRYSVAMRALIETNGLEAPYSLNPGQTVMLPPPNVHVVERGETLYSVSRRYNVDTRSLALMNNLERPWTVWPGDELALPPLARDQERDETPRAATPVVATPAAPPPQSSPARGSPQLMSRPPEQIASVKPQPVAPVGAPAPASASSGPAGPISMLPTRLASAPSVVSGVASGAAGSGTFIWPVSGPILSGFGVSADGTRNDGVNIGTEPGAQVRAAAAGEVVYAGNELSGFGNLLLIRHADGWVSAYAHADKLLVKEGDRVTQGQPVAVAGATGKAGGKPQVHFELRRGKDPVDPMGQLPAAG